MMSITRTHWFSGRNSDLVGQDPILTFEPLVGSNLIRTSFTCDGEFNLKKLWCRSWVRVNLCGMMFFTSQYVLVCGVSIVQDLWSMFWMGDGNWIEYVAFV